jgi:hypothetical protein
LRCGVGCELRGYLLLFAYLLVFHQTHQFVLLPYSGTTPRRLPTAKRPYRLGTLRQIKVIGISLGRPAVRESCRFVRWRWHSAACIARREGARRNVPRHGRCNGMPLSILKTLTLSQLKVSPPTTPTSLEQGDARIPALWPFCFLFWSHSPVRRCPQVRALLHHPQRGAEPPQEAVPTEGVEASERSARDCAQMRYNHMNIAYHACS